MRILLDTNILVHAHNKSSSHQGQARIIIEDAMTGKINACLTAQMIYEFFAVITNPKRVESPMRGDEAIDVCRDFWECREIEKIHPTPHGLVDTLVAAKEMNLTKARIFDCAIAITARDNKVECIYTENIADFKKYRFLTALNPFA